jgi:hypothetical protein
MTCLPAYLLLRPLLAGRRVLDLGWPVPGGDAVLLGAGVAALEVWRPSGAGLDDRWDLLLAAGSGRFDLVLALDLLDRLPEADRPRCLAGVGSLLAPEGVAALAVRNPAAALLDDAPDPSAGLDYWTFTDLVGQHFPRATWLGQSPMRGFYLSHLQPGATAEALSLADDQVAEPEEASHFVALASRGELPELPSYLLVTLPYYPLAQRVEAAAADRRRELASLRRELLELGEKVRQREAEVVRLAGRAARADRLEGELRQGRETESSLQATRLELARLAEEVERQRQTAAGLKKELDDARAASDDLQKIAADAQRAATHLVLERDQYSLRHDGLVEGHRELAGEYERLKIGQLEAQASLEAVQRERAGLIAQLEEARGQLGQLRREAQTLRERLLLVETDRDRMR